MAEKVELNISVKADGNGADQMDKLAKATERAASQQEKLQKSMGSGGVGSISKFIGPAAVAAAGTTAFAKSLDMTTSALNTLGNSSLTNAQKVGSLAAEFIPFAGALMRLRNAIDGTADRIRQSNLRMQTALAVNEGTFSNQALTLQYGSAQNQAARLALSYRGSRVAPIGYSGTTTRDGTPGGFYGMNYYDRATLGGERGYREELQRLPGIDARNEAERRAEAARRSVSDERFRMGPLNENLRIVTARRDRSQTAYDNLVASENRTGRRSASGRQDALNDLNIQNESVRQISSQRESQIARIRDAAVSASQAESTARQRNIDLMRTELQISEERTNRLISAAERFGAMNPLEQALSAGALRAVRDRGVRGVTPEVLARASALNPDYVRMQQRNRAETESGFQQLRDEGLLAEGTHGSISQNQEETERFRQQIRERTLADQAQLANDMADVMGEAWERILTTFEARIKQIEARIFFGQQNQFNSQN